MEKVSLQSKSNSSLDPSSYPKDLDPFGEDDDVQQPGQTISSYEVIKPSAPGDPSYPGTLDPFAEEEQQEKVKGKKELEVDSEDVKSNNQNRSNKRVSTISNQEKDPINISTNSNGGVSLETSITSRASDYDESLDPFGGDDETTTTTTGKTKADDRKSIVDSSKELRKPAIIYGEASGSGGNRTVKNDNLSIKSETESSSSGEIIKRGGEERRSYSNQNSPVPVPPRRKHRNVSPSTKSLNRASYSASSLEREPTNGISSPSSPDPNRLSTIEADSYLSHSTSNLSIRSTSPITTVRSSPIRSRKKRRAPDPPGFPPSVTSPLTPNTSLVITDQDTSIEATIGAINETINDTLNEPKDEVTNETPAETTPIPTPEPVSEPTAIIPGVTNSEPIKESNNETDIELNPEPEIEIKIETETENEKENEKEEEAVEEKAKVIEKGEEENVKEKEKKKSTESEIDDAEESSVDQKLKTTASTTNEPTTTTSSEPISEKTPEPESHTITTNSSTLNDSTADLTTKPDPDQSKNHQDTSNNL